MRKSVTILLALVLTAWSLPALAQQEVTIRELNAIPQDQIDQLNSLGTDVTGTDINGPEQGGNALIFNDLVGESVQFTAVVLSDPLNSGLSSPDDDGLPDRVHFFVRDVAAADEGMEGMSIQIVDGSWDTNGVDNLTVGDVIQVVGVVDPFFSTMQVAPTAIQVVGRYDDDNYNLPDSFLDPVTITTADANANAGEGVVLINWDNLASLRGQYVRIENATVVDRDVSTERPNWTITTDGGETFLSFYDTSLRFRNDQSDYNDEVFNVLEDDFVPPPIGAVVNVQAFLTMNADDPFNRSASDAILLSFNPWEDDDVEVTEAPPSITDISRPDFVPTTEPVEITFDVAADPERSLTGVELKYTTSASEEVQTVTATQGEGNTYSASIPAQDDGVFVTYYVEATDDQGGVTSTEDAAQTIRFLTDGIDAIEDVQLTADGGPGDSPFLGVTTDMDITATVQSQPSVSGIIALQDDDELAPWSGILLSGSELPALNRGDVVRVTNATVERVVLFGFNNETQLADATVEVVSTGGEFLGYKTVTTEALQDPSVAEAHEGMLLRFENITIMSTNADAPSGPFGEWLFSTDGTEENAVRADDASEAIDFGEDEDAAVEFEVGEIYEYIQGIWWYSFNNFKLVPEDLDTDLGAMTGTDVEDETVPGTFALEQNYPNPFNPTTEISYTVGQAGFVSLEVYDTLGRRVATLVNGTMPVGTYTATFDGANLASGVYLYRLTAGSTTLLRTMVLLK